MSARLGGLASLGIWLSIGACGAADTTVDPGDFALRDLLGVAPKVAAAWDDDQRAAARAVLASALRDDEAVELAEVVARADDADVVRTLAMTDLRLDDDGHDALGLVALSEPAPTRAAVALAAPATTAALRGEPAAAPVAIDVDAQAWPCPRGPCDLADLRGLAALATDAAPDAALVRVRPVVQLASVAALVAGADGVPVLLVNPIVTALGLGPDAEAAPSPPAGPSLAAPATPLPPPPLVTGSWNYGPTLADCAGSVQNECGTCLGGGLCESVWPTISGMDACVLLDADPSRNYALVCINLAVSLADVRACLLDRGSSCGVAATAIDTPAGLDANASFLDTPSCQDDLQICLDQLYGAGMGTGGSDGCGSCSGCDGCNSSTDNGSCNNSNDNSNCNGNGCNGNGCNGNGGGCGNGGSGGSCSIAQRSRHSPGLAVGLAWVLVPLPVALRARRRARRGRARLDADPA
ncbi:MAG: hypothetical protein IPL61_33145 [Myxococcales bacterium]|nr:hypothetical protein [Myxococcales bacterium]